MPPLSHLQTLYKGGWIIDFTQRFDDSMSSFSSEENKN